MEPTTQAPPLKTPLPAEVIYQGIAASAGIAQGPVYVKPRGKWAPELYEIEPAQVEAEQARFTRALAETRRHLTELREKVESLAGGDPSEIFDAHILVLEDPAVIKRVNSQIAKHLQNADYAFYVVMETYAEALRRVGDAYLRERTADVEDITQRVLLAFRGEPQLEHHAPDDPHIIMAFNLTPSDTAGMDRRSILGFVTEQGSVNSHTAILARALGIPAVVGLNASILDVPMLTPGIVDGYSGKFILNPGPITRARYRILAEEKDRIRKELATRRDVITDTRDNHHVTVSANMELLEELDIVLASGAKGVGLYRTEFLMLGTGELPDEEKQTEVYCHLTKVLAPQRIIIRTLDAGGDKLPAERMVEPEPNPFLGWRGVRVSLARPAIFRVQLRAILRASAEGPVAVMFPMVSGIREVLGARDMIKCCMEELDQEGVPFDPDIPVGIMVEVPSAAMCADILAPLVDFFSIGTNDLIQYTVAADRGNPLVAELYRPTHPAVIRLIKRTIDAGNEHGTWTGICGEVAGDIRLTPLLIGMGATELSVGPQLVARVGEAIRSLNSGDCQALSDEVMRQTRSADILRLTTELARKSYGYLLD